jgi:MerR family redox-sensitive transcriptional activator SoxR
MVKRPSPADFPAPPKVLTVGQVAARSGVAVSAVHYYEATGLIKGWRTAGNQRRYPDAVLRRVAVIKVARRMGLPLSAIRDALMSLPKGRTPTKDDWAVISMQWRADLDDRIYKLRRLRNELTGCMGCGCLSLDSCPLCTPEEEPPGP